MAHTSPIYVTCQDQYAVFDSASAQYMLTLIDGGLSYIRHRSPQHQEERRHITTGCPIILPILKRRFMRRLKRSIVACTNLGFRTR